ncbi:hypothetical protein [Eleftheria terrae]|uniref:hypothetical protein n=1 Tax=Eleftheria terrae TaxID=1597781 RepID=UPI00263B9299|nr:hypothetical protein [Eleftheria terrae]WKB54305.1 hypothetical protein N7L95_07935 [Eleftheria terrae]
MDSAAFNLETGKRFIERARDSLVSRTESMSPSRGIWIALALGLIAGASVAAWRVREKRRQAAAAEPDYLQRGQSQEASSRGLGADDSTSLSRNIDPYPASRSADALKSAPGTSTRQ